ncbi:Uncharacterised protein [Nocardia cyriacigeorgica]|uniref:Uncharacterized protein n=1 Tax=Nocardia cyriacigeorgica TaxID=135487 RepID=A0A4U8W843_9NOCA|nr:Uncharacterised protein [Nocardia cyriacigeorgica]
MGKPEVTLRKMTETEYRQAPRRTHSIGPGSVDRARAQDLSSHSFHGVRVADR